MAGESRSGKQTRVVPDEELSPRWRRRRERNRTALLSAARKVFEDRGYVEASVQDVIDAADVSRGTFYHYYDSKDAIFKHLVDDLVDTFLAAATDLPDERSIKTRLHLSISSLLKAAESNRKLLQAVNQAAHVSEDYARQWAVFGQRLHQAVARDLLWCMRHGIITGMPEAALEDRSLVIASMIESTLVRVATSDRATLEDIEPAIVELYWNAIFRPTEGADDYILRHGERPLPVIKERTASATATPAMSSDAVGLQMETER